MPSIAPLRRHLADVVLLAAATACGGDGPTPPSARGTGTLRLQHGTATPVWYVSARGCGATASGTDRLGEHVLMPDGTAQMPLPAGCHDACFASSPQHAKAHVRQDVQVAPAQPADVLRSAW